MVSIKGYIHPYAEILLANGSYIANDRGKFLKSRNLKKLNTMKNNPIKSIIKLSADLFQLIISDAIVI
jgi:hypothetical protein